ncbi:MAG: carbohydrate ABC transporter permease, partial [Bacteroidales bacterium]|nr:carbohydrate ABC transporter permease [Bacteroidales bacterium]
TGAFVRIILPLATSALSATLIYVFIYAWNEFLFAVTFTRSLNSRTLAVGLSLLIGQHILNWGLLAAGGVVSSIPVIILFMFIQKSMVAGITSGAVKG